MSEGASGWLSLLRADLLALLLLAVVAALLGLLRVPAGQPTSPPAATESVIPKLSLMEVQTAMAAGAVLLDARPSPFYQLGHLPGAISLPRTTWEIAWESLEPKPSKEAVLVVYCSGESCEDSRAVATLLIAKGYKSVKVFDGGVEAWENSGLPLATMEAP